jgi:hypothetical protein
MAVELVMGTAAQEAIRIAETYLPKASIKRKMALAHEIADAISLCEIELRQEIARDLEKLVAQF